MIEAVPRERVEKKTRVCPAAFDDDPFSALARRFRFYPGNRSLSPDVYTFPLAVRAPGCVLVPLLAPLSPRPIINERERGLVARRKLQRDAASQITHMYPMVVNWKSKKGE